MTPQSRLLRGRCLAFGQGVVYWPLSRWSAASAGSPKATTRRPSANDSTSGWPLLSAHEEADQAERRIAPIARLLGAAGSSQDPLADQQDQQDARESFFGAVRAVLEALAARGGAGARVGGHPLGRRGHPRPDRLPVALAAGAGAAGVPRAATSCSGAAPGGARMRRTATVTFLEPLAPQDAQALIRELLRASGAISEQAERARRALWRQPAVRRGDGAADRRGGRHRHRRAARHGAGSARGPPGRTRAFERQLVSHAAVSGGPSGRAPWSRWRSPPGSS